MMKKKHWVYGMMMVLGLGLLQARAATVDTVITWSASMKKSIKAVVIRPADYAQRQSMPVVYLLHGYSDVYNGWITRTRGLPEAADAHGMIIVCPDGGYSSWYWDSPADSSFRYETYIIKELVPWVDSSYKTIRDRKGRGITGLSMGGHGALWLAIRYQQVFGAAGSMSGGVDIRPFPLNWDMAKRLGKYSEFPERWDNYTVINTLHLLEPKSLALMIDCGTEDFFLDVNKRLHEELLYRKIPHDFLLRPGGHNWPYWNNAVQFQLLFMHRYFSTPA